MVEHGDPGRCATDDSESFGASIKDGIHRRCMRRRLGKGTTTHKKHLADGTVKEWKQRALSVSRVMQAFRDISVREKLLREAKSTPYLQRKHFTTKSTGFVTDVWQPTATENLERAKPASVAAKMEEGRKFS